MTGSSVVIVKPSSLGDIVHTLPAVHYLKSTFPLTDFFWIANSEWAPILQDNSDLKGVIAFPRSRLRSPASFYQFLRWRNGLSVLKPELVLDFQGLLRSVRFVVLHPFSRGTDKSLTTSEITQLLKALAPHPVIVVGRSNQDVFANRNAISLVNQTDLDQLIWLFRRASFIVSVDSGPMHIGAAITTSLLSIHTWSDPRFVGPYTPDAWVWKEQQICRVRSLPAKGPWKISRARPDPIQIAEFVHERVLL